MSYAVIAIGGKQYRVREGERLLVDRLPDDEGATLKPTVLLLGGEGEPDLSPAEGVVTARVVGHVLGDKVRIGKYKPKKGYRRHTGFRARLSQIEIAEIGATGRAAMGKTRAATRAEPQPETAAPAATLPSGYEDMTVVQINEAARDWELDALQAALAYEREHAARKGAVAALESAIAAKESD
jgi:large subunit ribosomal protein L21